jgi:beta-lactamase class A
MQVPLPTNFNIHVTSSYVASGQTNSLFKSEVQLRKNINQTIKDNEAQGITTSVSLTDVNDNRTILQHNQAGVHFAASVNKVPIAWLVLQDLRADKYHLSDTITWTQDDVRGGYGTYDQPGAPTTATIGDVIYDLLNHSGNTAVRILVNHKLGGAAAVNDRLSAYPQIPNTRLQPLDSNRFYVGNSTSKESIWILEKLLAKKDSNQHFMKNALATNMFGYYGVRSQLGGNDYITLVNKVGILDDTDGNNRHDVGIIYNTKTHKAYGYSFMTTTPYTNIPGTAQAEHSLDLFGRAFLQFSGDKMQQNKLQPFGATQTPESEEKVLY